MPQYKTKRYSDCYLYGIGDYEKNLYQYFIRSEVLNKNSEAFEDIKYDVKRLQPSMSLTRTLESPNVVLLYHEAPLPRAFKVFTAKDLKSGDNKLKVFIDMSDIVSTKNGITIHPSHMDKFISYLTSALVMRIYYSFPERLLNKSDIVRTSTQCFAELFSYVIDYLRISGTDNLREKCLYMASMYYQINILGKDPGMGSIETVAKNISKISNKTMELVDIQMENDVFKNINTFVQNIAKVINAKDLKLDNFIEKWATLYGSGTHFALEYYPAFSTMITNAYNGSYLNNQKIIEKICGKDLVTYTVAVFRTGDELS